MVNMNPITKYRSDRRARMWRKVGEFVGGLFLMLAIVVVSIGAMIIL